ncbi:hypothetical protein GWK47_027006 [Chionoecetes opilio]|uniref:Uncharacterized protein n=1 Tax=Chionoecetes opilio TaxID=41210 RepID=A0A8J8WC11_CHIOP|nr:hypothetical protein GWK47_027006 [Chionoecetes opilio]
MFTIESAQFHDSNKVAVRSVMISPDFRSVPADKSEAGNMADFDIKEEDIEIKEEADEVKQENPETEESGSTARRGEKRVLSPSHSPETKKQRTEVEQVWIKEEEFLDDVPARPSQPSPVPAPVKNRRGHLHRHQDGHQRGGKLPNSRSGRN